MGFANDLIPGWMANDPDFLKVWDEELARAARENAIVFAPEDQPRFPLGRAEPDPDPYIYLPDWEEDEDFTDGVTFESVSSDDDHTILMKVGGRDYLLLTGDEMRELTEAVYAYHEGYNRRA